MFEYVPYQSFTLTQSMYKIYPFLHELWVIELFFIFT